MFDFYDIFLLTSLGVFFILFGGRSLSIKLKKKINPIKIHFKKNGKKRTLEIAVFLIVNLFVIEAVLYSISSGFRIFPYTLNLRIFEYTAFKIAGIVFIIIGFIFFGKALSDLGYSWRLGIDDKNPGNLITRGIYSLSRNPIYIFFNLYFFGVFMVTSNMIFLIFFIIQFILLHLEIMEEEKFLIEKFGVYYTDYCKKTGRYITFLKRNNDFFK